MSTNERNGFTYVTERIASGDDTYAYHEDWDGDEDLVVTCADCDTDLPNLLPIEGVERLCTPCLRDRIWAE